MEILIANSTREFHKKTRLYDLYLEPYISRFLSVIRDDRYLMDVQILREYSSFIRWPIRRLEYSYVLKHALGRLTENSMILDAGCGVSPLVGFFGDRSKKVLGVDSDSRTLYFAKIVNRNRCGYNVVYGCQDIMSLGVTVNTFNIITCISVLEHLPMGADTKALENLFSLLRPGGVLIVTVDLRPDWSLQYVSAKVHDLLITQRDVSKLFKIIVRYGRQASTSRPRPQNRAYTLDEVNHHLLCSLNSFLLGERIHVNPYTIDEVRDFWKRHRFPGCGYKNHRDYNALGFVLRKPMY